MLLFLDSALPNEIELALDHWDIDGVTTNPRHVATTGRPHLEVYRDIAQLVADTDKPVSVEVNPHITDWRTMVQQGLELATLSPNFVIKVGASEDGFRAVLV